MTAIKRVSTSINNLNLLHLEISGSSLLVLNEMSDKAGKTSASAVLQTAPIKAMNNPTFGIIAEMITETN